jgi:hypothetical protein
MSKILTNDDWSASDPLEFQKLSIKLYYISKLYLTLIDKFCPLIIRGLLLNIGQMIRLRITNFSARGRVADTSKAFSWLSLIGSLK